MLTPLLRDSLPPDLTLAFPPIGLSYSLWLSLRCTTEAEFVHPAASVTPQRGEDVCASVAQSGSSDSRDERGHGLLC